MFDDGLGIFDEIKRLDSRLRLLEALVYVVQGLEESDQVFARVLDCLCGYPELFEEIPLCQFIGIFGQHKTPQDLARRSLFGSYTACRLRVAVL